MIPALCHLASSPALLHAPDNGISGIDLVVPLLMATYMCACFIARKEVQLLSNKAVTAVGTPKQPAQVLRALDGATRRPQLIGTESQAAPFPSFAGGTGSIWLKCGEVWVILPVPYQLDERQAYAGHTKQAPKQQKAMGGAAIC